MRESYTKDAVSFDLHREWDGHFFISLDFELYICDFKHHCKTGSIVNDIGRTDDNFLQNRRRDDLQPQRMRSVLISDHFLLRLHLVKIDLVLGRIALDLVANRIDGGLQIWSFVVYMSRLVRFQFIR